jgi:hypothetical protein
MRCLRNLADLHDYDALDDIVDSIPSDDASVQRAILRLARVRRPQWLRRIDFVCALYADPSQVERLCAELVAHGDLERGGSPRRGPMWRARAVQQ